MSLRGPKHLRVLEEPLGIRGHTAFPQKLFKRFETYNVFKPTSSGASHQYAVQANSAFAPMGALTGLSAITSVYGSTTSQPRGWDQWTAYYSSYYVYAAELYITARIITTATTTGIHRKVGMYVSNANSALSRYELDERGITNHFYDVNSAASGNSLHSVLRLRRGAHSTDVLQHDDITEVSAAVGASPTKLWYIVIRDEDITGDVASVGCTYDLKLVQWVKLFDPIAPAAS